MFALYIIFDFHDVSFWVAIFRACALVLGDPENAKALCSSPILFPDVLSLTSQPEIRSGAYILHYCCIFMNFFWACVLLQEGVPWSSVLGWPVIVIYAGLNANLMISFALV